MENFDAIFSLPAGGEVLNTHGAGNYSFTKDGENSYTLDINGGYARIEMKFAIEMAKGVVHWDYGAASVREMHENEEMRNSPAEHLFLYLGKNKIDLWENIFPTEIRISKSRVTYDPTGPGDLEFELDIMFGNGDPNWKRSLSFTVEPHRTNRYQFTYLDKTYDSEDGELEKFNL